MESNTVNIKNLPQVEEIIPGNYIIVEDQEGSKILDFQNFVIGPNNTSFYNPLVTTINTISTYSTSLCSTIANNQNQVKQFTDNRFVQLTASFAAENPRWYVFIGDILIGGPQYSADLTNIRGRIGTDSFVTDRDDIRLNDVTVTPDFNFNSVYVQAVQLLNTPVGNSTNLYNYTINLTTNSVPLCGARYAYRVLKPVFN